MLGAISAPLEQHRLALKLRPLMAGELYLAGKLLYPVYVWRDGLFQEVMNSGEVPSKEKIRELIRSQIREVFMYSEDIKGVREQLDQALDQGYEALTRTPRLLSLPGSYDKHTTHIAQLQVDGALLFERVTNTLKLLGDQYLARVYRLVSQRFHLEDWDASILRKLETLESIYGKMSDRAGTRRMELLEWIIIVLITISIAVSFIPWSNH